MRKGFTLIELLVVISIIGVMSSVVLASVNAARASSRNAQRNATVAQYKVALELAYDASNAFPDSQGQYRCLGTYPGNCWVGSYANSSIVDAAVLPFMSGKPTPITTGLIWDGLLYYRNNPQSYVLLWFLEGANKNCDPGTTYFPNYDGRNTTYCRLDR